MLLIVLLGLFAAFCFWMALTHPSLEKNPCPLCGRRARFTTNKVCQSCDAVFVQDVQGRHRVIQESMKLVAKSKKMDTRLSRCDVIIDHAGALIPYERKGLTTVEPAPSKLIAEFQEERQRILVEGTTKVVDDLLDKADVAATVRSALNQTSKALVRIREAREQAADQAVFDELEHRVDLFAQEHQVQGYVEEGEKAAFKGNRRKALDRFQEALFVLQKAAPEIRERYEDGVRKRVEGLGEEE